MKKLISAITAAALALTGIGSVPVTAADFRDAPFFSESDPSTLDADYAGFEKLFTIQHKPDSYCRLTHYYIKSGTHQLLAVEIDGDRLKMTMQVKPDFDPYTDVYPAIRRYVPFESGDQGVSISGSEIKLDLRIGDTAEFLPKAQKMLKVLSGYGEVSECTVEMGMACANYGYFPYSPTYYHNVSDEDIELLKAYVSEKETGYTVNVTEVSDYTCCELVPDSDISFEEQVETAKMIADDLNICPMILTQCLANNFVIEQDIDILEGKTVLIDYDSDSLIPIYGGSFYNFKDCADLDEFVEKGFVEQTACMINYNSPDELYKHLVDYWVIECYDEKDGRLVSNDEVSFHEQAYKNYLDDNFAAEHIDPDVKVLGKYCLSGKRLNERDVVYYKTDMGDYVYYDNYRLGWDGQLFMPVEKFCELQRELYDVHTARSTEEEPNFLPFSIDIDFDLDPYRLAKLNGAYIDSSTSKEPLPLLSSDDVSDEIKKELGILVEQKRKLQPSIWVEDENFLRVMRVYNCYLNSFADRNNIDDFEFYKLWYVVEYKDGTMKFYDNDLKPAESNRITFVDDQMVYLPPIYVDERSFSVYHSDDIVQKYISPDAVVESKYFLYGRNNQDTDIIYFRTNLGDYIYYRGGTECWFTLDEFVDIKQKQRDYDIRHAYSDDGEPTGGSNGYDLSMVDISPYAINTDREITLHGDANCDGRLTIADAAAVLQALGNADKYGLTEQGKTNADLTGDGLTTADAVAIQKKISG